MRVIDLLNKIANGEEVPKKVSINAVIHGIDTWVYDEHYQDYKNGADEMLLYSGMTSNHLNDEVEIIEEEPRDIEVCGSLFTRSEYNRLAGIEEDKKIEKLTIGDTLILVPTDEIGVKASYSDDYNTLANKINEIIDYIEEK